MNDRNAPVVFLLWESIYRWRKIYNYYRRVIDRRDVTEKLVYYTACFLFLKRGNFVVTVW